MELGDRIPDFALEDQDGRTRRFEDLVGPAGLILYAYPKDNTPGCTREAEGFREALEHLQAHGYRVVGVSKDSARSHAGFCSRYALNFPLLADTERTLLIALGAWGIKKNYGKESEGTLRTTFVFDAAGVLTKLYKNVKVDGHAEKLAADLDA